MFLLATLSFVSYFPYCTLSHVKLVNTADGRALPLIPPFNLILDRAAPINLSRNDFILANL